MAGMMRKLEWAGVCAVALLISNSTFAQSDGFAVVERGPDWKVMQKTTLENGTNRVHRYTVLGNGMNRRDASGNWVECAPVIRGFPEAVVCTGATYQVIFKRNLNQMGSVDFETSDRERIVSHPLALAYFDPEDGRREWIARIQDCQASIAGNKVVFADAFDVPGIEASVVYTYGAGRFHQDVVFTKKPGITPADLGMGSRTRLEVVTEIVQSPVPSKKTRVLKREKNTARRGQMAEPDMADETLVFSKEMRMPLGYAFAVDPAHTNRPSRVPVAKRLRSFPDGRTFLTESVEWNDVRAELDRLPGLTAGVGTGRDNGTLAQAIPSRPSGRLDARPFFRRLVETARSEAMQMASANVPRGVVVDYTILQRSYSTWLPSGTYLIPEDATAELEVPCELQNCVFKFGRNACLYIDDWDPYATPDMVFTALDDDSVGEVIAGSTGQPSGYYGLLECTFPSLPLPGLGSLDFRYMNQAMSISVWEPDATLTLSYPVYLRHCDVGFVINDLGNNLTLSVAHPHACDVQTYIETNNNTYTSPYATPDAADCDGDYDNDGMDDGWEVRYFGNTSQGPAGDYDNDGMTNLEEYQMGTNPLAASDSDADGLPDGWEWRWFHHFNHTGSDLDGNGKTLLYDWQNGFDPNVIRFETTVTNKWLSTTNTSVRISIRSGEPACYAMFVNGASTTNWLPYVGSNIVAVNLGPADGTNTVYVGFKGISTDATQTWNTRNLILDRVPPGLMITNPVLASASVNVFKPILQLQGCADEDVAALACGISNAHGAAIQQPVFSSGRAPGIDSARSKTNWFRAYDVPLAPNANVITLRVSDRAGNTTTTNFTVILDGAGALSPTLSVLWPTNGMAISGSTTTLRGTTRDETGTIQATVVNGDGTTNTINGLVGRNGLFWIENVPLSGTNQVNIRATDATGAHATTTNIVLYPSALRVTIESTPTGDALYLPRGTVSGTVSAPGATVSVNGVAATVESGANASGTYNWSAADVPVHGRGTAVFNVQASVGAAPGGGSQTNVNETTEIDKPAKIVTACHECASSTDGRHIRYEDHSNFHLAYESLLNPGPSQEAPWFQSYEGHGNLQTRDESATSFQESGWFWSQDLPTGLMLVTNYEGQVACVTNLSGDHLDIPARDHRDFNNANDCVVHYYADNVRHTRQYRPDGVNERQWREASANASTQQILYTGGKPGVKRVALYQLCPTAQAYGEPPLEEDDFFSYAWENTPWTNVPPTLLKVGNHGFAGADGNLWLVLPDDSDPIDVTIMAEGCDHYNADVTQQKVRLELRTVRFTSASDLLKDDGSGPYPTPHWTNDVTGTTNQSCPILFTSGDKITTSTEFAVSGSGGFPVVIKGVVAGGLTNYTLWSESTNAPSGLIWPVAMTMTNTLLANTVDCFNPMTIDWYYGDPRGINYVYAGQSTNRAYVSWKTPQTASLFHTVVDVACRNAKGQTNATNIITAIWSDFADKKVNKADGTGPMQYWGIQAIIKMNSEDALLTTDKLVKYSDGQCAAWSHFFHDSIKSHGITNTFYKAIMPYSSGQAPHKIWVKNQNTDPVYTIPPKKPLPILGIDGQGNDDPISVFRNHAIVECAWGIYDPSYGGDMFSNLHAWQQGSLDAVSFNEGGIYNLMITNVGMATFVKYYYTEQ